MLELKASYLLEKNRDEERDNGIQNLKPNNAPMKQKMSNARMAPRIQRTRARGLVLRPVKIRKHREGPGFGKDEQCSTFVQTKTEIKDWYINIKMVTK